MIRIFFSIYLSYVLNFSEIRLDSVVLCAALIRATIYFYENPGPDRGIDAKQIGDQIKRDIEKKISSASAKPPK